MDLRGIYIETIDAPVGNPHLTDKARAELAAWIDREIKLVVDAAFHCGAPRVAIIVNGRRYGQIINVQQTAA